MSSRAHHAKNAAFHSDQSSFASAGTSRAKLSVPGVVGPSEDMVEGITDLQDGSLESAPAAWLTFETYHQRLGDISPDVENGARSLEQVHQRSILA